MNNGRVNTSSFQKCVERFFEYKKAKLKAVTLKTYQIHSRFLLEYFKKTDPNSIDADMYKDYERWRRKYLVIPPE